MKMIVMFELKCACKTTVTNIKQNNVTYPFALHLVREFYHRYDRDVITFESPLGISFAVTKPKIVISRNFMYYIGCN